MNAVGKLREHEQAFKNDRLYRLILNIRRFRSEQLQKLLSHPEEMDVQTFNREVWPLGHAYLSDDEKIDVYQLKNSATINKLEDALQNDTLVYKGNSMWGSGTRVFAPMIKNENEKIELIRTALDILTSEEYTPEEKAKNIQEIKGFGPNIATGLVMVFHPRAFMIFNEKSKEAYRLLKQEAGNGEEFQQYMQQLKADLHMEDFLELDYFLYTWVQTNSDAALAFPFSETFSNKSEAEWAFDFVADVFKKLGVENQDDERLAITYRRNMDGLHVNFCNWIILGLYPSGEIRIPLFQKYEDFHSPATKGRDAGLSTSGRPFPGVLPKGEKKTGRMCPDH
ncbi:hypothetical protein [Natribacillus halophilus]|uniref:Uncharacterized protein n=1 Tax=Natribacillus halophilus TaxID=549003 RepID=A0A1G8LBV1_9BACI|nr:hypothetical protein [Natribacillus halophilus]SDI53189.1 hypothetical protein SAMN04488123_10315 [Natribacillus halophilus]